MKAILKAHPNIDLVYANDGLLACFTTWLKKETNIRVVATVHGLDVVHPNAFYQHFIKKNLAKLDAVIAVSRATGTACLSRGLQEEKVFVVKNGIDHDLANIPVEKDFLANFEAKYQLNLQGKKILVTMGRPVKRKGFSWFVKEVVPQLEEDTVLLLIGPRNNKIPLLRKLLPAFLRKQIELAFGVATDEEVLQQLLQQPAIRQKAIEVGKLPFSEIIQLLSAADLFVMPNIQVAGDMEGFGLVALEAAIRGTPVLASGIEGIQDAVQNGENGYLLPSKDAAVWVATINKLVHENDELEALSRKAKSFTIANYSWKLMAEAYRNIFEEVVEQDMPNLKDLAYLTPEPLAFD